MEANLKQFSLAVLVSEYKSDLKNFVLPSYRFICLSVSTNLFSVPGALVLTSVHCIMHVYKK